jgi:hypothetical protein
MKSIKQRTDRPDLIRMASISPVTSPTISDGIVRAQAAQEAAAARLASRFDPETGSADSAGVAQDVAELSSAGVAVAASAKVLKIQNEQARQLIDLIA